jgi:hypothetical protein
VDVELTPVVGGMLYLGELPQEFQLTATDGSIVRLSGQELDHSAVFGGRAALRFADRFGVGATVLYSPTTATGSSGAAADVGIWSYGLNASYHLATPSPLVQPFLIGGLGAKTYDFDGMDALTHFPRKGAGRHPCGGKRRRWAGLRCPSPRAGVRRPCW